MRRYTKTAPRWTQERQRAAQAAKQAKRDQLPDEDREDRRPVLIIRIGPEEGAPHVHWRLTPIRGQIRRYRVTDADTGDMVHDADGQRVGGGRDAILRSAAKRLPTFASIRSLLS